MLVALVNEAADARRLREAVDPTLSITWCRRADELVGLASQAQLVLAEPLDADGTPVADAISQLRARAPHLPVIAYAGLAPASVRALASMAAHTLHSVIIRGVDDSRATLREVIHDAMARACETQFWHSVIPVIPSEAHGIVRYCIQQAGYPLTVSMLAHAVGLPERTLNARLRRSKLPSAQELIAWSRLVRVSCLLHNPTLTLEVVAERLGFATPSAVNALVMRLLCVTPSALRRADAVSRTMEALRARLTG